MKNLALTLTFVFVFISAFVGADLQKPFTDTIYGFQISMPEGWIHVPLPPTENFSNLQEDDDQEDLFNEYSVKTLCKFTGPDNKAYHAVPLFILYKVGVKNLEEGVCYLKKYAEDRELGTPSFDDCFDCSDKQAKMHSMDFKQSIENWDMSHKYYIAQQPNGIFMLRFEYDCMCDIGKHKLGEDLEESAKTFGFKKIEEATEETGKEKSRLLPGWEEIEGDRYVIQFKGGTKNKIKKFLTFLEKLDKCHRKLITADKQIEKNRPIEPGKETKLLVKYFEDEKSLASYASKRGETGLIAYYSPSHDEVVFYDTGDDGKTLAHLAHEATHMYLRHFVGDRRVGLGMWIDEGLADYFYSAAVKKPNSISPGHVVTDWLREVQKDKRDNLLPTVAAFIEWDRATYNKQYIAHSYACSFTHYLLQSKDKEHKAIILDYLYELQRLTFPKLKKLYDGGKEIWTYKKGEECSEGKRITDELYILHHKAQKKVFENIDMGKLQKDFFDYLR